MSGCGHARRHHLKLQGHGTNPKPLTVLSRLSLSLFTIFEKIGLSFSYIFDPQKYTQPILLVIYTYIPTHITTYIILQIPAQIYNQYNMIPTQDLLQLHYL